MKTAWSANPLVVRKIDKVCLAGNPCYTFVRPRTDIANDLWLQHFDSTRNRTGRAAVVLDTGAASRGSGNDWIEKEKTLRQWFADHYLIESYRYLPKNLFYNTTAPGIVLFLNKAKPKTWNGKVFFVHASRVFEKGSPKSFIPDHRIHLITYHRIVLTAATLDVNIGHAKPPTTN